MQKLFLTVLLSVSFLISKAAFVKDTSFPGYKEFFHLSKREIKDRFYKDDDSQKIIDNYYKHRRKSTGLLYGIIPLTAIGTYIAIASSNSTNGLGGVVLLVLALIFLLPALALLFAFLISILTKKKSYTKHFFYEELRAYFQSHYK